MPTTIRDIARVANVSHTTVSRVLNGQGGSFISEATRQRVLSAVEEMNYRPNRAARALATGRTHTIALWINDLFHPYFAQVMHYAGQQIERQGYDIAIYKTRGRDANGVNHPEQNPAHWPVDGVLALDDPGKVERFLVESPEARRIPLVSMGVYACRGTDHVAVDLYPAAAEAMQHLAASGRRRIAYLTNSKGNEPGEGRHDAYRDVMRETGREPEILFAQNDRPTSRQAVKAYVAAHGAPDALFCMCDDMALGAYRGLLDLGLRVPDDVALVGCDGIEDTEYLEVPLSTIDMPLEQMCARAGRFLETRLADPGAPMQSDILKARFVPRESSGQ
jgi:LacI family transcriptional regulator